MTLATLLLVPAMLASAPPDDPKVLALSRDLETEGGSRLDALLELKEMRERAAPSIPSLLCLIEETIPDAVVPHGGDSDLRTASETLSSIGPLIIAPITEVFEAPCGSPVGSRVDGQPCRLALPSWQEDERPGYCEWVRSRLADALGGLPLEALPELLALFRKPGPHRPYVAQALGSFGRRSQEVVPALLSGLRDGDAVLAVVCVGALGHIGSPAREAVPALRELLDSQHDELRRAAQQALLSIECGSN